MTVKLYQVNVFSFSATNWCDGMDLLPAVWYVKHNHYKNPTELTQRAMDDFVGKLILSAVREVMRTPHYEMDGIPSVRELRAIAAPNRYGHSYFVTICYNRQHGYLSTWGGKAGPDGRINWTCYMD